MADKLRPDELAAFKAAFDMFDKNQDGTISTKVSFAFKYGLVKSYYHEVSNVLRKLYHCIEII